MKNLQSFVENSHKCETDVYFLGQYVLTDVHKDVLFSNGVTLTF